MGNSLLLVVGHVSIDRVRTRNGEHTQLGGAALYAAMGAKVLTDNVRIITSVGKDFKHINFLYSNFPNSLVRQVKSPTTFFGITYDEKLARAKYDEFRLGAGAVIRSSDIPTNWLTGNELLHVAPMHPEKTKSLVTRVRKLSPSTYISVNSNLGYLSSSRNRKTLNEVSELVDLFILNDQEAVTLSQAGSLSKAVFGLRAKRAVITLGELGAIIVEDGKSQMIPALGALTVKATDTTGAGDTWCGALLAAYSITRDWTKSVVAGCIVSAIKCLGWGLEKIKTLRFQQPDELVDYVLRVRDGTSQISLEGFINQKRHS
ncbi:MAG: carbohydrate kinase family protein [Candidatus Bathyarchaeia archaeon]